MSEAPVLSMSDLATVDLGQSFRLDLHPGWTFTVEDIDEGWVYVNGVSDDGKRRAGRFQVTS